jgi:hypothetical protein
MTCKSLRQLACELRHLGPKINHTWTALLTDENEAREFFGRLLRV